MKKKRVGVIRGHIRVAFETVETGGPGPIDNVPMANIAPWVG